MTATRSVTGVERPRVPFALPTIGTSIGVFLLGILCLVIGLGIGVRWLTVDGLTVVSVAGVILLVCGSWLVVRAIRRLRPTRPGPVRVLATALLTLLAALAVWALTPAVIATVVPPIRPGASTPTDYGIDARSVEYETADGVTIRAWYSPSTNGATVILRHGAGSDASTVLPQAGVLAGHGFGLLVTDARGHGRSEGRAMEFGWFGDLDIGAGVDFLTAQPEFDAGQIAVVGMSMGGEEAIGAIGSDPRIAAVVAEGATARTDADKRWLAEEYGFRGRVQLGLEWVQYGLTDLFTDASKPSPLATAAHSASPRPLLLIAGGEMADEVKVVEYLAAESGDNVSIWTVTDSGHIQGLATDPAAWEERVVGFLETALIQGG